MQLGHGLLSELTLWSNDVMTGKPMLFTKLRDLDGRTQATGCAGAAGCAASAGQSRVGRANLLACDRL